MESLALLNAMEITQGHYTFTELRQLKESGSQEWSEILFALGAAEARMMANNPKKVED